MRTGFQDGRATTILSAFSRPSVRAATSASRRTAGGYVVAVSGSDFGLSAVDIDRIMIGSNECTNVEYLSPSRVNCRAPAGAGRLLPVLLYNSAGA